MRKVILSKRASIRLRELLEYLETNWSVNDKDDFIRKLEKALKQIQNFPDSAVESDSFKGLHMLVVTKQTSVFYRHDPKTIKVITLFENRMNPKRITREIK